MQQGPSEHRTRQRLSGCIFQVGGHGFISSLAVKHYLLWNPIQLVREAALTNVNAQETQTA